MKLNVLKNTVMTFISLCTVVSCAKNDDYELSNNEKVLSAFTDRIVSSSGIASRTTTTIKAYSIDGAVEGYVISGGEGGNFYRKIYIQSEDKTQALPVVLDESGIYTEFPIGAEVQLRLEGLTTQLNNAITEVGYKVYRSGKSDRESIGSMAGAIYKTHLYDMDGERKTLVSLARGVIFIDAVKNDASARQLITLESIHFPDGVVGRMMYDKNKDLGRATNYKPIDANGETIDFRANSYAGFKNEKIPAGTLNITRVLSKFNTPWQFMVSNHTDIKVVSSATATSAQTNTQAAAVVALDAATVTVTDYIVDKRVKLYGIITIKGNRTCITSKDNTKIQVYAPREVTLSQVTKDKLLVAGHKIAVTRVFTDYPLKSGTMVGGIIYNKEGDIEFIKVLTIVPQITALDTTTATVANSEANKDKRVLLRDTLTPETKDTYTHLSSNTKIQVFVVSSIYKKLLTEAKSKLKTAGQKVGMKGAFDVYNGNKQIKHEDASDLIFKN